MGRSLRSGRQIKSLSPPKQRGGARKAAASDVPKSTKPAPAKAGRANKAAQKQQIAKEEEEKDSTASESGSESESGSDSESSDEVEKVAPVPLKKAKVAAKEESSDDDSGSEEDSSKGEEEEESEDDDDGDDDDQGFTDENAKWLKPKQSKMKLMDSDEDDNEDDDEFGSASEEGSDDEMLEVERQSRIIDEEMKLEQEEAESELRRTIAQQTSVYHLPTAEELEEDENRVVPPSELRERIDDILEVLADFKTRREPGRSRSEYIERLAQDMAELFGYLQELVDYFLSMFGPNECLEFLEASDKSRPLVVRVNTLKARRKDLAAALMKRGLHASKCSIHVPSDGAWASTW